MIMSNNPNNIDQMLIKVPGQNVFDETHDIKTSGRMGLLMPVMAKEVLPGEIVNISTEAMVRFMPMLAPVMHTYDFIVDNWFVPNRIMWDPWEDFITLTKDDMGNMPVPPFITIDSTNWAASRDPDWFGIPKPIGLTHEDISAFPFYAKQLIWENFYRDENLQKGDAYEISRTPLVDGDNTSNTHLLTTRRVAWQHDYFTSLLPFTQKGDPVYIPMTFPDVPVKWDVGLLAPGTAQWATIGTPGGLNADGGTPTPGGSGGAQWIYAETSTMTGAALINDLREAEAIQKWLEKLARTGSRYNEWLATWGVRNKDARLQLPEYMGGVKTRVIVSEVLNTTGTVDSPQGSMAGHGIAVADGYNTHYRCDDYGWVIQVAFLRPKTAYMQGIDRKWTRKVALDYYNSDLANLGEEAVTNREIYAFQGGAGDNVFGYKARFQEYRMYNSLVTGQMRDTLQFWQHGRNFATPPALNSDFIECNPDDSIFAVQDPDEDNLVIMYINKIKSIKPVAKYGVPSLT